MKGISKAILRIITVGAAIAWVLGAIALHMILHFPIAVAIVVAGLFLITGPTVIQPLLKQAKVRKMSIQFYVGKVLFLIPLAPY